MELQNFKDREIDAVPEDSADRISPIDVTIKDRALMGFIYHYPTSRFLIIIIIKNRDVG